APGAVVVQESLQTLVDIGTHQDIGFIRPRVACARGFHTLQFLPLFFGQFNHDFLLAHILPGFSRSRKTERFRPPLSPGDVLAFPNAGAYGLYASPAFDCPGCMREARQDDVSSAVRRPCGAEWAADRMAAKETVMIELTEQQQQALDAGP